MLRNVFGKVVHDQWRGLAAWTVFAGVLAAFYLSLYPSLGSLAEMQKLLEAMPPALRAIFVAEGLDFSTPVGYLNMELFNFILPLVVVGYAATVGSGATAGEEERGTLDLLLANPVPRWRVVADKAIALVLGSIILVTGIWIALALTATALDIAIDRGRLAQALASGGFLGMAFGGVAMAIGALTGRRTLSLAVAIGLAVIGFFTYAMSSLVAALEPWRPLSPIYHYIGNDPLNNGLDPGHAAVLLAIWAAATLVAVFAFERRDIRG